MNPHHTPPIRFRLALAVLLALAPLSSTAQTLVGLIDFADGDGQFGVVNTNNPVGPWAYDPALGSWSCFDMDDCAPPFRSSRLNSPVLTVVTPGIHTVTFRHRYSFEPLSGNTVWDGGQLRLSVNGGPYEEVPRPSFTLSPYNEVIGGDFVPNSELLGHDVFALESQDYTNGTYIFSTATLGTFETDDTLSIQFIAAWDDCAHGLVPNWEIVSTEFIPFLEDRKAPPTFPDANLPADTNVVQGIDAVLTVEADGIPAPTLQWYRNGSAISGATNATLVVATDFPFLAAGEYFVRASNVAGTNDSRIATLTVTPDTFPPGLESGTVQLDGKVRLSFDEPMDPTVFDSFSIFLFETGQDPFSGTIYAIASATFTNETDWLMTMIDPLPSGLNLSVFIGPFSVADRFGNSPETESTHPLARELYLMRIDENTIWTYDQSGNDYILSSPAYYEESFDDSDWPAGAALLGTESNPGALPAPLRTPVLNSGSGGPITTYYRTRFILPGAASGVEALALGVVVDDGALVYLNGTEILRLSIPEGRTASSFSSFTVNDAQFEGLFAVDPGLLRDGENILAAEVHQASTTSSDNIWGAELSATINAIVERPLTIITQPDPGPIELDERDSYTLSVLASGFPPLFYQWFLDGQPLADATNPTYVIASAIPSDSGTYTVEITDLTDTVTSDPAVVNVTCDCSGPVLTDALARSDLTTIVLEFSEALDPVTATNTANYSVSTQSGGDGVAVIGASLNGATVTLLTEPRAEDNYQLTVQNVTDTAVGSNLIVPNPTVVPLSSEVVLLEVDGATLWRYRDDGVDLGPAALPDPDLGWAEAGFADGSWATGAALFWNDFTPPSGGADTVRTTLSLTNAPGVTNELSQDRVITYYFRTDLELNLDLSSTLLFFQPALDDGGVFYVNGTEALRLRMPDGAVTSTTLATGGSLNGNAYDEPAPVDGTAWVQGGNLLAAEVHQSSSTSSDVTFGLRVLARVDSVQPTLRITSVSLDAAGNLLLQHNGTSVGTDVYVQETDALSQDPAGTLWTPRDGGPHPSPHNAGPATRTRFFRVTDSP